MKASELMELAMKLEKVEAGIKSEILGIPVNRRKTIEEKLETLRVVEAKRRKAWREHVVAIQTNLNI